MSIHDICATKGMGNALFQLNAVLYQNSKGQATSLQLSKLSLLEVDNYLASGLFPDAVIQISIVQKLFLNFSFIKKSFGTLWNFLEYLDYKLGTKLVLLFAQQKEYIPPINWKDFFQINDYEEFCTYFQSADLAFQNTPLWRKLLSESKVFQVNLREAPQSRIAVHRRLGDYRLFPEIGILEKDYFRKILDTLPDVPLMVVSDEPQLARAEFSAMGYQVNSPTLGENNTVSDFFTLIKSEYLIISNSTFSWWAAYFAQLVNPNVKIYAPFPWRADGKGSELFSDNFTWMKSEFMRSTSK